MKVSNSLDSDQARHFVGPDCGQTVCKGSVDDTTRRRRVYYVVLLRL